MEMERVSEELMLMQSVSAEGMGPILCRIHPEEHTSHKVIGAYRIALDSIVQNMTS